MNKPEIAHGSNADPSERSVRGLPRVEVAPTVARMIALAHRAAGRLISPLQALSFRGDPGSALFDSREVAA